MKRQIIPTILILATMAIALGLPKPKYQSPDMLSKLYIPASFNGWRSRDISGELNKDNVGMNFISGIIARAYESISGRTLLFIVLDAGNFHNPKVCMGSSGYSARDLNDIKIPLPNKRSVTAHAVYFSAKGAGLVIMYWIVIDKKPVNWAQQKIRQFWYSMFNKEKVGLMVRMDIPVDDGDIEEGIKTGTQFIQDISSRITPEQGEYLFGE